MVNIMMTIVRWLLYFKGHVLQHTGGNPMRKEWKVRNLLIN
jgi:hypothetical protein